MKTNPNIAPNLLPYDGEVYYFGKILSDEDTNNYLKILFNTIPWDYDILHIFGKKIITKRKTAWFGDRSFAYTYSGSTKYALPWTKELVALKQLVENRTGTSYNSCLLNLYHNGSEGMSWHSDNEKELLEQGIIASLSLGSERKFSFKHKTTKQTISLNLEHGSLLVMRGTTQTHWLHSLPVSKRIHTPRINLTFRNIVEH